MTCPGPDRLIATGKGLDLEKAARDPGSGGPGWGGPAIQAMRERLKTEDGIAAYRHRGHIAETPHGHIKHNMGLRQLLYARQTQSSRRMDLRLPPCTTCSKRISTGHLTGQALANRGQLTRPRRHRRPGPLRRAAMTAQPGERFRNSPSIR